MFFSFSQKFRILTLICGYDILKTDKMKRERMRDMKRFERFFFIISVLCMIAAVAIVVIQWKKDSDVWRSLKRAAIEKELFKLQ